MLSTSCFAPWCFQRSSWCGANTTGQLDFGEPVPSSFSCWGSFCKGGRYLPEPVLWPRFLLHQHHHVQVGQGVLCVRWCWFTWQLDSDWNCCSYLKFVSGWLKIWNRMTASVLKQDPDIKRFNKMLIYYDMMVWAVWPFHRMIWSAQCFHHHTVWAVWPFHHTLWTVWPFCHVTVWTVWPFHQGIAWTVWPFYRVTVWTVWPFHQGIAWTVWPFHHVWLIWPFHHGKGWICWLFHGGTIWTVCPCAHALFLIAVWLLCSSHLFLMTQGNLSLMALPWCNCIGWRHKTPITYPDDAVTFSSWRSDLFLMTQCDLFLMTQCVLFLMTQCDILLMTLTFSSWHSVTFSS